MFYPEPAAVHPDASVEHAESPHFVVMKGMRCLRRAFLGAPTKDHLQGLRLDSIERCEVQASFARPSVELRLRVRAGLVGLLKLLQHPCVFDRVSPI